MPHIDFSKDWNGKLECQVFTTIRRWTPEKWEYYSHMLNHDFDIMLKNVKQREATLFYIADPLLRDIPVLTLCCDTGMTEVQAIYALFRDFGIKRQDEKVILLAFKASEPYLSDDTCVGDSDTPPEPGSG